MARASGRKERRMTPWNTRTRAVFWTAAALVLLGALVVVFLTKQTRGSERRVGVFLFAQHQVIRDIADGFEARLNTIATERRSSVRYSVRNADGDAAQSNSIA